MSNRRQNLRVLTDKHGGATAVAKRMGWSGPSYVSQLIKGNRPITEKGAEKIESEFGLAQGWMDQDNPVPATVDDSLVIKLMQAFADAAQALGVTIGPRRLAKLVEMHYEETARAGKVDRAKIRKMVEMLKEE